MADSPPAHVPDSYQTARSQAVQALVRIETDGAHVSRIQEHLTLPDPRAERRRTEYIAGVTRWRRWLDYHLSQRYHGDYENMEPVLRQILRLGAYELLKMETPVHAAVHEAVTLAKTMVRPKAGGLVNAVLRNVARSEHALAEPDTGRPQRDLAIQHSHPTWMVRRWLDRFGRDATLRLLEANNERPTFGLRVNTLRTTVAAFTSDLDRREILWAPSAWLDDFVRVDNIQPVVHAGLLEEGQCAVQDEGAALVVRLFDPQPGERILDVCAAPGGKSLYAALRMHDEGQVTAADVHVSRLGLVATAAQQHGLTSITTQAADLLAASASLPVADRVLVDAPCSGLGVLAKRADLRWQRAEEDIAQLITLQDRLLDAAATRVAPGGLLVYSTCSILPEENEHRVASFLERHPDFYHEPVPSGLLPAAVVREGCLATLPHEHGIDGAFAARLRRR